MTDWRNEQIGVGVSRVPDDDENYDLDRCDCLPCRRAVERGGRAALRPGILERHPNITVDHPLPIRESPMQGETTGKPPRARAASFRQFVKRLLS